MAKKSAAKPTVASRRLKSSALVDTRVIYCGDNIEQLKKLPKDCVDLIYIDPPFNSNRNYEVFWGETKEKRAFEDRHESTRAYIDYMRPVAWNLHASSKKPAAFITTATGTPATTSKSCSTRFSARIIFKTKSFGNAVAHTAIQKDTAQITIQFSFTPVERMHGFGINNSLLTTSNTSNKTIATTMTRAAFEFQT